MSAFFLSALPRCRNSQPAVRSLRRSSVLSRASDVSIALCLARRHVSAGQDRSLSASSHLASSPVQSSSSLVWTQALHHVLSVTSSTAAPHARLNSSVVAQLADHCLLSEGRRLYAVYRPCDPQMPSSLSTSSASPSSLARAVATPEDFLLLLRLLPSLGLAELYAPRVAQILLELLRKPLHPQYGVLSAWDLSEAQVDGIMGEALHLVCAALPGPVALDWLDEVLGCRRLTSPDQSPLSPLADRDAIESDEAESEAQRAARSPLVSTALRERLLHPARPSSVASLVPPRVIALDAVGAERLVCAPSVVACVAAALIRTDTVAAKQEAMALLELAASARFFANETRRDRGDRTGHRPLALFSEDVAVECAEAAAVMGDSETVARLTFLLYRCRGALGVATLSERTAQSRQHARPSSSLSGSATAPRLWSRLVAPLSATWRGRGGGSAATDAWDGEMTADDEDDIHFERAAVRMLKAVIRAALRHPPTADSASHTTPPATAEHTPPEMSEALALFEALRAGTTWAGTAAMVVELLTFLSNAVQRPDAAVTLSAATRLVYQRTALYLLSVLLRSAGSPERQSDGQRRILAVCVARVMEVVASGTTQVVNHIGAGDAEGGGASIPAVTTAQAPLVLGLFGLVDAAHQVALLPYALAGVAAILVSPPSALTEALSVVALHELDSPSLHSSLRALLLHGPGASLPNLLRPVNRFFTTAAADGASTTSAATDSIRRAMTDAGNLSSAPSGALLLILSLLLRHHQRHESALAVREALVALSPLSAMFATWWEQADAVRRRLVWLWLLHPRALSAPPFAGDDGGGEVVAEAITTVLNASATPTKAVSTEEATHMVRVLYMYADSRARPLVDALLTRLFGFTILTRSTADLVREIQSRATSASARCAMVVVGASTVQASLESNLTMTPSEVPLGDEVQYLQRFLRYAVETSGGGVGRRAPSSLPAKVVVILTLDGLLALPITTASASPPSASATTRTEKAHKTDNELVSPVARALSVQLRGLAPPSSEVAVPVALEVVVLAPLDAGKRASSSSLWVPASNDGCVECTALASDLARQLSTEQRPLLFFWSEDLSGHASTVGRPAFSAKAASDADVDGDDDVARWVSRHHIRLLSARRVLVERAKLGVIALLRPGPAPHTSSLSASTSRDVAKTAVVAPQRKGVKGLSSDASRRPHFSK